MFSNIFHRIFHRCFNITCILRPDKKDSERQTEYALSINNNYNNNEYNFNILAIFLQITRVTA